MYMDFLIPRTTPNPKIRMNTHESYVIRMRAKTKPKEIGAVWRALASVYRTLKPYSIAFQTCSMTLEEHVLAHQPHRGHELVQPTIFLTHIFFPYSTAVVSVFNPICNYTDKRVVALLSIKSDSDSDMETRFKRDTETASMDYINITAWQNIRAN